MIDFSLQNVEDYLKYAPIITKKQEAVKHLERISCNASRENEELRMYRLVNTGSRIAFLAVSPISGRIAASFYAVGLLVGLIQPLNCDLVDSLELMVSSSTQFQRDNLLLQRISKRFTGSGVDTYPQQREHAIVSKCGTIALFLGCLMNYVHTNRPPIAPQRAPAFLIGSLGVALSYSSYNYRVQRNEAMIYEAKSLQKTLSE